MYSSRRILTGLLLAVCLTGICRDVFAADCNYCTQARLRSNGQVQEVCFGKFPSQSAAQSYMNQATASLRQWYTYSSPYVKGNCTTEQVWEIRWVVYQYGYGYKREIYGETRRNLTLEQARQIYFNSPNGIRPPGSEIVYVRRVR